MARNHSLHVIEQCCLYKLSSRKKLAQLLFTSARALEDLAIVENRYSTWEIAKSSGGKRLIEAPHDNLKATQKRIANLLHRISPPDYLMAPAKGRSYVDNAALHVGSRAFCLLDIENFFPSCTDKRVYCFFNKKMLCSPDVASILTKLTTLHGHLPQGSPCSPILAFFAYVDMWEAINDITSKSSCRLSIYADDITISGDTVYERDIWAIKKALHKHGHRYSRKKQRHLIDKPADITGVIVSGDYLLLPNRQHEKLTATKAELQLAKCNEDRERLSRQLRGRVSQARQVLDHQSKRLQS